MATNMSDVVVSSRVRLARNIAGLPFPRRMKYNDERIYKELLPSIENAIGNSFKYKHYVMATTSDIEKEALMEKHLISRDLIRNSALGRAIISDDNTMSIMINEEDHIRAQCLLPGFNLEEAYKRIDAFDDALSKNIAIAFDEKLGYLTSCPTNLGTGMRASAMMFLPALTLLGSVDTFSSTASKLGLTIRGVYGEGSDADGYLYQVSNEVSLGITEKDILRRVDTFVRRIAENELAARDILIKREGTHIIDKICRAYGILTNAYMIDHDECMSLLSLLKLGVGAHIIKDIEMSKLNDITSNIGVGAICLEAGKALGAEERDIERAKIVKNALKN